MLYLKASSTVEAMSEYDGKPGMFIKTFAFNTVRNKNGWRVTWESIKNNISDFSKNQRPGIEYTKCTEAGCDLDHTDASTYEASLEVQEPFRKTTIIDYTLNETDETAFFIHKTDDQDFFNKIQTGELKYVSPSIWPLSVVLLGGKMPNGEPILDVHDWKALHDAFVNDPAFGEDAKVVTTCEGENCQMQMLTAKQIKESPELDGVPVLIKHKGVLHYVSLSAKAEHEINKLAKAKGGFSGTSVAEILKNNSLNACVCSSKIAMAEKTDKENLEAVTAQLKAATDEKAKSDEKVKELESKIAKMEKEAKKGAIAACDKCGSTDHTTENHTDENSADNDNDGDESAKQAKQLKATVQKLESKLAQPMIVEMLSAREQNGATKEQLDSFSKSLNAKSYEQIETQYNDEKILIKNLAAKTEEQKTHFDFNTAVPGALTAKSLEETFEEVVA